MKTEALTEKSLAKLKVSPGERDAFAFDATLPGFYLRRYASGAASYGVKFSVGPQQRRLSLGPAIPGVLADMRRKAANILTRARLGEDVVVTKRAAAAKAEADRNRMTLGEAINSYLTARAGELRPRSFEETRRYLLDLWKPLHSQYLDAITRDEVVGLLNGIEERGKVTTDRARLAKCLLRMGHRSRSRRCHSPGECPSSWEAGDARPRPDGKRVGGSPDGLRR